MKKDDFTLLPSVVWAPCVVFTMLLMTILRYKSLNYKKLKMA